MGICKNGHCICNNRNKPQGTSGRQVNIGQVNCQNGKCVWNTRNRKTNDEMESWQLRFMNCTTVHGAGVPPEIWVRQPAEEKKETKETWVPHKQNKTMTGGRQGNICQMICKNGHCICNNIRKRPQGKIGEEDLVEDQGYEDWGAIHQTLLEEAIPAKAMQNIFKILQEWKLKKNDDEEDDEDEEEFEELESLVTSPRCGMVDARAMQNTLILLLPLYYN